MVEYQSDTERRAAELYKRAEGDTPYNRAWAAIIERYGIKSALDIDQLWNHDMTEATVDRRLRLYRQHPELVELLAALREASNAVARFVWTDIINPARDSVRDA